MSSAKFWLMVIVVLVLLAIVVAWSWPSRLNDTSSQTATVLSRFISLFQTQATPVVKKGPDPLTIAFCQKNRDNDTANCEKLDDSHQYFCCTLNASCLYSACMGEGGAAASCIAQFDRTCSDYIWPSKMIKK